MNILLFLSGIGVGAVVIALLFLVVVGYAAGGTKEARATAKRQGEESAEALRERNEISKRMAASLNVIANWCEQSLKRE